MKNHDDKNDISEELLNSYLDNELDAEDKDELLNALEDDAELSRRLCELRNVKELTQHAYQMRSSPMRQHGSWSQDGFPLSAVATVLVLITGALVGWFAHDGMERPSTVLAGLSGDSRLANLEKAGISQQKKIILHVDSAEPERFAAALDSAESLLAAYSEQNRTLEMEIIANSDGLNLFRVDTTEHADRIRELKRKYGNLSLLACNRAIRRLEEQGIKVELIPEAEITPTALDEIVRRLQQGWVYIKV